jgi:hypothetical protein
LPTWPSRTAAADVADDRSEGIWRRLALPVMHRFRSRRGQAILERFPDLGSMRVCDVGGSAHFWESIGLADDHSKSII